MSYIDVRCTICKRYYIDDDLYTTEELLENPEEAFYDFYDEE